MKQAESLATVVTGITAMVIAAAMLVYAAFQYLTMPGMTLAGLFFEHLWHVLGLGVLTYAALHVLLHRNVVEPIRQLLVKLYGIAHGDDTPMVIESNIREVQEISESVNLMLAQLHRTSHEPWVEKLRGHAVDLRDLSSGDAGEFAVSGREKLIRAASELEELATVIERFEARVQNLDHEIL